MSQMGLDTNLAGHTALVCGASQGIGQATAILLAQMGASVVLLARTEEKLKITLDQLPRPSAHRILAIDLLDRQKLKQQLQKVLKIHPIDILVCNAGGPKAGPLMDADESAFVEAFESHVLANQLLVQLCLPTMRQQNYGRIINIISTSVRQPIPQLGVSNTIRSAVAAWSKTLSLELAPVGITVNNILPGYTLTPRLDDLLETDRQRRQISRSEAEQAWKKAVPLGRFAEPKEVANAIGFLASPAASYITGVSLAVDGGRISAI